MPAWLDKIITIARYDAIIGLRYQRAFVLKAAALVLELVTTYYMARAIGPQFRPDGLDYFSFLLTGTCVSVFLINVVHAFVNLVSEAQTSGTMEILMTTPTHPVALLFMKLIPALAVQTAGVVIYLGVGFAVFNRAGLHPNIAGAVIVLVLLIALSTSIGLAAAAVQVMVQRGSALVWLIGIASGLLMGTVFPLDVLPAPLKLLATALPFRYPLDAFRNALVRGDSVATLLPTIVTLFVYTAVLLPLGFAVFTWAIRRARMEGTLSFY